MKRAPLIALAAAAAIVAIAVGSAGATGTASTVKVTTPSGLQYSPKLLKATSGKVTIVYTNKSGIPHDVRVKQGAKKIGGTKIISKGTTSASVTLAKGTYTFYCSVPGHEAAGMKGKLTVS